MYVEPWVELQVNLNQLCFLFSFQWDILCDDAKKYVPLTKTIFYAGKLFGAYFFGWVSDRYGRRMTLLITMLVQFIASLIESFSVNFTMYVVLRVPLGICSGGKIKYLHVLVYKLVSFATSSAGLDRSHATLSASWIAWLRPLRLCRMYACAHPIQGETLSHSPSVCFKAGGRNVRN